MSDYFEVNRANWDDRVPLHVASSFYDVERQLIAPRGLRPWEVEVLGDVAGLDVAHLQCHFGLDSLALARAGARVTGLDFSPAALREARTLAERAGLTERVRFVEADVLDAADALEPSRFDLVYVSLGALCWLPSIERWASQASALLRPRGRLYVHDCHPLAWSLAPDGPRIVRSYFEEPVPFADDAGYTYTDGDGRLAHRLAYEWNHSIGETVSALLDCGLRLEMLHEHDWTVWPCFDWLVQGDDHLWTTPPDSPRMALTFTLVASVPDRSNVNGPHREART